MSDLGSGTLGPQTQVTQEDQAAQTLLMLHQAQQWLPADTLTALGTSGLSPQAANNVAQSMKGVYAQAGGGINNLFQDDVLQKQPTMLTSIKDFLTSVTGPPPIEAKDIQTVQQGLQAKGFGRDLQVGTPWNQGWMGAYRNYIDAYNTAILQGAHKPASSTAGGALHWLTDIMPKEAGNALLGFVRAMPHEARQLSSDLAGVVAGGAELITRPDRGLSGALKYGEQFAQADMNQEAGNTQSQNVSHFSPLAHLAEDVNTVLMLTSAAHAAVSVGEALASGAGEAASGVSTREAFANGVRYATGPIDTSQGGSVANLIRANNAQDLGFDQAIRGPGIIARSMGKSAVLVDRGITGATDAGRSLLNLPSLERSGTWVGKLADADGLYYRARTLAALPYVWKPVELVGKGIQGMGLLGGAARLDAQVLKTLVGSNPYSTDVQNTHVLDVVQGILNRNAAINAFGLHIKPSIDDLAYFLHAPAGIEGASSKAINDRLATWGDSLDYALGHAGVYQSLERATGMPLKQIMTNAGVYKGDAEQQALRELTFKKWLTTKVHDFALQTATGPGSVDIQNRLNDLAEAGHQVPSRAADDWLPLVQWPVEENILNDTDRMDKLREALLSDPGRLDMMWKREIELSAQKGQPELTPGFHKYLTAVEHLPTVKQYEHLLISSIHDQRNLALANHQLAQESGFLGPDEQFNDPFHNYGVSLARLGTVTKSDNERRLQAFQDAYNNALEVTDPKQKTAALNKLHSVLADYVLKNFQVDGPKMPHDIPGFLDLIHKWSNLLAENANLPRDAPAELRAANQQIRALGYKLVVGRNIDWMTRDIKALSDHELGAPLAFRRKLVSFLGLNPQRMPSMPAAVFRETNAMHAVDQLSKDPTWHGAPGYTAASYIAAIKDRDNFVRAPGLGIRIGTAIRTPERAMVTAREIERAKTPGLKGQALENAALGRVRQDAAADLGLMGIKRKDIVRHFTQDLRDVEAREPGTAALARVRNGNLPGQLMTQRDAERLADAILDGYAKGGPNYMLGLSHLDTMLRSGFGFMGKALPGEWGERVANLANDYIRLRNEFRFALNPELSLRKITKVNFQLLANDVVPTLRPYKKMLQAGTLEHDMAVLKRVDPHNMAGATADLERELEANDIFHLYNHEDYKAYAAGQWARDGLSDQRIAERLVRVFDYGSFYGGKVGRSAAERSMNFMFFPFSFDKKLYRNLGYYLLDHPAQLLLLSHALAAYDQFDKQNPNSPLSTTWIQQHMPIATEMNRLNAFAHGVSLGQFGGVNAPVLNLFLGHVVHMNQDDVGQKVNAIQQFIPAIKMAQNLMSEGHQQAKIIGVGFANRWMDIWGRTPVTSASTGLQFKNIQEANVTKYTQFQDGYAMYQKLEDEFANILKYNTGKKKADQFKIPLNPMFGKFAGEPFTRTTLREIIHARYPAFTVAGGEEAAAIDQAKVDQYLLNIKGSKDAQAIEWVLSNAQSVARNIGGTGSITYNGQSINPSPQERLDIQNAIRKVAVTIAEHDPKFKMIWDKYFTASIGPLEKVS